MLGFLHRVLTSEIRLKLRFPLFLKPLGVYGLINSVKHRVPPDFAKTITEQPIKGQTVLE